MNRNTECKEIFFSAQISNWYKTPFLVYLFNKKKIKNDSWITLMLLVLDKYLFTLTK